MNSVQLSADGATLAAGVNGKVTVWNAQTGQLLRTIDPGNYDDAYAEVENAGKLPIKPVKILNGGKTLLTTGNRTVPRTAVTSPMRDDSAVVLIGESSLRTGTVQGPASDRETRQSFVVVGHVREAIRTGRQFSGGTMSVPRSRRHPDSGQLRFKPLSACIRNARVLRRQPLEVRETIHVLQP